MFIEGRVKVEDERDGKLICESITSFDEIPRKVWLKFPDMSTYLKKESELFDAIYESEGIDNVVIYIEETRQKRPCRPTATSRRTVLSSTGFGIYLARKM